MALNLESIVCRGAGAMAAEFADETMLLGIKDGVYYGLRDTSHDIWFGIAEPVRIRDLCAALAERYKAPIAAIESDTLRFLERLVDQGIVAELS